MLHFPLHYLSIERFGRGERSKNVGVPFVCWHLCGSRGSSREPTTELKNRTRGNPCPYFFSYNKVSPSSTGLMDHVPLCST